MEIKFKKDVDKLKKEIKLKSVDLDETRKFQINLEDYINEDKYINISPRCIRCDLCVEECPVNAIQSSNINKTAQILNNCVKCEICAQTCPISAIYVLKGVTKSNKNKDIEYKITELNIPHRKLKMENININRSKCVMCGNCTKYCPTNAIKLRTKKYIEEKTKKENPQMDNEHKYPFIKEKICIGCGSCAHLCMQNAISLKRNLCPIIINNKITIDEDVCVGCFLCEENCPTGAIKVQDGKAVLDDKKCIRCRECTLRCPVRALELKPIEKEKI